MQIELLIEGNASLLEAVQSARIDLAVIIGGDGTGAGETIGHLEIAWIAPASFILREKQPLPLAVLGPKCAFRRRAIERLEAADIPHRIAASSPSLDGLWAAMRGGLGVTALRRSTFPRACLRSGVARLARAWEPAGHSAPQRRCKRGRPWIAWRRF